MIGKTISHYKIFEHLGRGGMGDVYKAEDIKLNRTVALKFLPTDLTGDDEAQQRFIHEARTASALDHPNIGTIYEINEEDGHTFIAMAYYEGDTLKDKIDSNKTGLDIEECLDIASQIADGLSRAHSKEIIHRDIKPANILMTEEGQVKIIDFGLAKLKGHTMLTKTGTTLGTVAYMSPEQTRGEVVDHRSDIWSLGVMIYEMLAGEQPFKGDYDQAIIYSIMNEEPEFITKIRSEVPVEIERILIKALEKNPEKRYQSVKEMLEALKDAKKDLKAGALKIRAFRLGRKQRKALVRIVAVAIIVIAAGLYIWQSEVAKAAPVSIAVMPLGSYSGDSGQDWFTDSFTDALITDLGKVSRLRLISHASTRQYIGTNKIPPDIAIELGVQYLIEGSVVKIENRVNIRVRLLDASRNEYLWTEEYEREFSDILTLQGEIAHSIASQVQVELTPQEKTRLAVTRKVDPETHELYLKGMYHLKKYTPDGFARGLGYLHQAVEKDPDEPLAHAGLALGYNLIAHSPTPAPGALDNARKAVLRAMELDTNLAEVHLALAMIKIYSDWNKAGAERSYKRALELNPSLVEAYNHYAWYLNLIGKNDEAIASLKQAQALDPITPAYTAWLAMLYFNLGRYDEATEEAEKALELQPDFPIALFALGSCYAAKGMFEQAIASNKRVAEISPDWGFGLGQAYALAGWKEEARQVAIELENRNMMWGTWGLALIYADLGDTDKAIHWLEAASEQRHPYIQWIYRFPDFNFMWGDPRFEELAQRLNVSK